MAIRATDLTILMGFLLLAGAGIASSASAFAALTLAAASAAGLHLTEPELSALARLGSGSAARSVPGGFVEWAVGQDGQAETYNWPWCCWKCASTRGRPRNQAVQASRCRRWLMAHRAPAS